MKKIDLLEVILKISERCNIDCTYCYYFNGLNHDYKDKPAYISLKTMLDIAYFLRKAVKDNSISKIQIDLHGGGYDA